MTTIFLACAIVGGLIMLFQFVLMFVGMGDADVDIAEDVPDLDIDMSVDVVDGDVDSGNLDAGDPHGSSSVFGVLSFRTVVAAITFFGFAGMAAQTSGAGVPVQMTVAFAAGIAAMYGVYYLMRSVYGLGQSGSMRISSTVGRTATVYIPIPAGNTGPGKVQVKVQDRLEEFTAVTSAEEKLVTGAKVVVVRVVGTSTLEVEPLSEPVEMQA